MHKLDHRWNKAELELQRKLCRNCLNQSKMTQHGNALHKSKGEKPDFLTTTTINECIKTTCCTNIKGYCKWTSYTSCQKHDCFTHTHAIFLIRGSCKPIDEYPCTEDPCYQRDETAVPVTNVTTSFIASCWITSLIRVNNGMYSQFWVDLTQNLLVVWPF